MAPVSASASASAALSDLSDATPVPSYGEVVGPDVSGIITEDDTPVDNFASEKQQRLLTEPLYSSWSGPPPRATEAASQAAAEPPAEPESLAPPPHPRRFLAAANVGVFATPREPLVPDVFLSLDVQVDPDWWNKAHRSYFLWEFGKPPELVLEIVSNREGGELGRKKRRYAEMRVTHYVVWDPQALLGTERLQAFELRGDLYIPREPRFEWLGLGLAVWRGTYEGLEAEWLRWHTLDGALVPTGAERADAAQQRADAEQERADAERQRADAERQRAQAVERRNRQLVERLAALGVSVDEDEDGGS